MIHCAYQKIALIIAHPFGLGIGLLRDQIIILIAFWLLRGKFGTFMSIGDNNLVL